MKAAALVAVVMGLLFAYQGQAQEPAPAQADLGQANLLLLACAYATDKAVAEGLTVRYCRRQEPEKVDGYRARVSIKIATDVGRFLVQVDFQKSLWWATSFGVTPG